LLIHQIDTEIAVIEAGLDKLEPPAHEHRGERAGADRIGATRDLPFDRGDPHVARVLLQMERCTD
jgi:hypothetical protein